MKKFIFLFFVFLNTLLFAQNYDTKAEFPGGQNAFRNEFMKMVHGYVDLTAYSVNGKFSFVLTIDEKGKMSELKIYPKVKDDENFKQDMNFAMKRIKKKWKPAIQNGTPVSSNVVFEINFSSEHADHGD